VQQSRNTWQKTPNFTISHWFANSVRGALRAERK